MRVHHHPNQQHHHPRQSGGPELGIFVLVMGLLLAATATLIVNASGIFQ